MHQFGSASGKALLFGEYAVLDGAPAIVMALDRRAVVRIVDTDEPRHSLAMSGFANQSCQFTVDRSGRFNWFGILAADATLVECGIRESGVRFENPCEIEIDSRQFYEKNTGAKLGIGSSAAVTVALQAALDPGRERTVLSARAQNAHRSFQDGRGSGADVAASLYGGVIVYHRENPDAPDRLAWPDGLHFRLVQTGAPVDTVDRIARFESGARKSSSLTRLAELASTVCQTWHEGDAGSILEEMKRYVQRLKDFSVDHNLRIFDGGHTVLCDSAEAMRLVYKPCGAGGGDVGIVFGTDDDVIGEFVAEVMRRGCRPLDAMVDWRGVELGCEQ